MPEIGDTRIAYNGHNYKIQSFQEAHGWQDVGYPSNREIESTGFAPRWIWWGQNGKSPTYEHIEEARYHAWLAERSVKGAVADQARLAAKWVIVE